MKANNTQGLGILKRLLSGKESSGSYSVFINSNRELALFKCTGLVEYTQEKVILCAIDTVITVSGKGLELKTFSTSEICVTGIINKLEFDKTGAEI